MGFLGNRNKFKTHNLADVPGTSKISTFWAPVLLAGYVAFAAVTDKFQSMEEGFDRWKRGIDYDPTELRNKPQPCNIQTQPILVEFPFEENARTSPLAEAFSVAMPPEAVKYIVDNGSEILISGYAKRNAQDLYPAIYSAWQSGRELSPENVRTLRQNHENNLQVAFERARSIKALFIRMGIPENQLETFNLGYGSFNSPGKRAVEVRICSNGGGFLKSRLPAPLAPHALK